MKYSQHLNLNLNASHFPAARIRIEIDYKILLASRALQLSAPTILPTENEAPEKSILPPHLLCEPLQTSQNDLPPSHLHILLSKVVFPSATKTPLAPTYRKPKTYLYFYSGGGSNSLILQRKLHLLLLPDAPLLRSLTKKSAAVTRFVSSKRPKTDISWSVAV